MGRNGAEVLEEQHRQLQQLFHRVSQPDEDRREVLKQLVISLSAHVSMEKQVLVPALRDRVVDSSALVERLIADHDEVDRLLTLLERRKANSPDVPGMVTELLDITDRHVTEADTKVIPALRKTLDAPELERLGEGMESDEQQLLTHPHPHLPDSGPLAGLTKRAAELVDRIRDSSSDIGRSGT